MVLLGGVAELLGGHSGIWWKKVAQVPRRARVILVERGSLEVFLI